MTIKNCPKCKKEFDDYSKWGPKKFCSRACANSREQTAEVKAKKSKAIMKQSSCKFCQRVFDSVGSTKNHERTCNKNPKAVSASFLGKHHSLKTKLIQGKRNGMGLKVPQNILDMSKRTVTKVLARMGVGCSKCGWNESTCDIHHIIPKSKGGTNDNSNLTILCPNCHRLAHNQKINDFVSIQYQVGELWRQYYYAHE